MLANGALCVLIVSVVGLSTRTGEVPGWAPGWKVALLLLSPSCSAPVLNSHLELGGS